MEIKDVIRQRRLEKGLTMKELAIKVGVSEATVSRWESGDIATMKQTKIGALSKALGISPAIFVKGSPAPADQPELTAQEKNHLDKYRQLTDDNKADIDKQTDKLLRLQELEGQEATSSTAG